MCTWRSVSPRDVITNRLTFAHRIGETYKVNYSSRQRWCYFSKVTNEEAILLKTFDSLDDGRTSRFCLHSAFDLLEQKERADAGKPRLPARQSTEVRLMVFWGEGLEDFAGNFVPPHMAPDSVNEITEGLVRQESLTFGDKW